MNEIYHLVDTGVACRLCLATTKDVRDAFTKCDDGVSFSEKIATTLQLELDISTSLSYSVCQHCFIKICEFYTYYQQIHKTNDHLNDLRQATKSQTVTVVEPDNNQLTDYKESNCEEEIEIDPGGVSTNEQSEESCEENEVENPISDLVISQLYAPEDSQSYQNDSKIDLPEHLKKRIPKAKGDQQIKDFIDIKCTICGCKQAHFDTYKEMQMHYEQVHNTRGYILCCGKKIYRKDRVMDHIAVHVNPNAFKCPVCNHSSKSRVLLRIHMKQHLPSEKWPFQCEKCNQRFVLRSQLTNHEATHLSDEEKKFICDECGKVFALKFVLLKHKLTHSKDKRFYCESCAKSFSNQASLIAHVKQHENTTKPNVKVQCNECGLWYKNIQTLRTHENRHRDTRDHTCEICNRKCSSRSSLSAHVKYVHMKTTLWECSICNKRFRRKPELTEHMARHTGEVLYTCSYCPKTFHSSSNYFAHRKIRHQNEYSELLATSKKIQSTAH